MLGYTTQNQNRFTSSLLVKRQNGIILPGPVTAENK